MLYQRAYELNLMHNNTKMSDSKFMINLDIFIPSAVNILRSTPLFSVNLAALKRWCWNIVQQIPCDHLERGQVLQSQW